jgi:hypothetical protein
MICKGTIQENNRSIPCWLPADPVSLFQLCRRCYFHHITFVLDTLTSEYAQGVLHPRNEILLNNSVFLNELLHPAREQALLNLLFSLYMYNKIQFFRVLEMFKHKSVFSILITKRIQHHQPGTRCKMYRVLLKNNTLYKSEDLCWNCWSCVAWVLKQDEPRLFHMFRRSYPLQLVKMNYQEFQHIGSKDILDILVSLYLRKEDHMIKITIQRFFLEFPLEEMKEFLCTVFQQPALHAVLFLKEEPKYLPLALQDKVVIDEFKRMLKNHIKQKTDLFKEELVMKTWHPDRFMKWCLDTDDLLDFTHTE